MRIPAAVELKVVAKLYEDAQALDWASLSPQQHSSQYARWMSDPDVGGKLGEYLGETEARVWIKDGPMKEWRRAHSGVGKYAALVKEGQGFPDLMVRKALGESWCADRETIQVKPLRVVARNGEDDVVVTWGNARDLKHLVWAALRSNAEGDARPWVLCVVETFTRPTPENEKQAHGRLAARCNLTIKHLSVE